ncbi:isoprenoid synthase domain-containing protein [Desarmillaria tabescens]|uniref:Isoprenoid synthase domain-containing protein n=1 Tax=Armillaria tabescens TaxID=1929756 RepID=A0AA39JIB2_ARMTA|nr:isoprenoid synthase domain-containing protein [Desarmillaria tabescens]KAK0442301.1 isoprenoid synthase domain-containing protein [Desarmillaria tabescens]
MLCDIRCLQSPALVYSRRTMQSGASTLSRLSGSALHPKPNTSSEDIRDIIRSFLHKFDTTDLPSVEDAALEDLCIKEAERRGYALDVLKPSLIVGLNIAASAYHHLVDVNVKVYITFFTMFLTYFDDAYPDDPDILVGVPRFTKYFMSSEKQPSKMMNDLANLLAETSQLFGEVTADLIVHATLRFITGLVLETRSKYEPTHRVDKYAMFLREISGIPDAYAMFIFPADLPYDVYIQSLPLLRDVINFMNDITSFYKEECEGETHNLISLLAEANGKPKSRTLRYVVEKCMEAHERTLRILSPHKEAHRIYQEFVKGYLAFHLGAKRYRLGELNL